MTNIVHAIKEKLGTFTTKLVITFSLFIILIILILELVQFFGVPFMAFKGRWEEQRQEIFKNMEFIADLKRTQLINWLEDIREDVNIIARDRFIVSNMDLLRGITDEFTSNSPEQAKLSPQSGDIRNGKAARDYFNMIISTYGHFRNVYVADPETGTIIFSSAPSYVGIDVSEEHYFKKTIETLTAHTSDVILTRQGESPAVYFTDIMRDQENKVIAVLVVEVLVDKFIQSMLLTGEALGESGETVLVNQDSYLLSSLKYLLPDGNNAIPLSFQVESLPATLAASGTDGIIETSDYRDVPVLAAFRHIRIENDLGWGLVVKMDRAETFAHLQSALWRTSIIALGSMIISVMLTLFIARTITGPIRVLSRGAEAIADGDLSIQIPVAGSTEIATAAKTFNTMVNRIKDAQEEMTRQERLATLGQFSGSVSHELRNPLGVIDSSAYYLKMKLKDADKKVQQHLDRIQSSVGSATAIIESLLNLTRMKEPQLAEIDLIAVTRDAIATSKVPSTVNVVRNFPKQEVLVIADGEQLRMAFKNVVKNALEAMDGRGTLTVAVQSTNDGHVEVSFADTGPGIAAENLERVFEPLFTTKATGIGFGLSITKMLINKHGGTVEAESEPGKGATIVLRLPLHIEARKEA